MLISFHNCFSSITLFFFPMEEKRERRHRHILYGVAIFDSLLYVSAIVCFSFAMASPAAPSVSGVGGMLHGSLGNVGLIVMLVALFLKIMSIPIIGFVVLCVLSLEILLIILVGYLIMKFLGKLMEDDNCL
jgi:hypothetical protein